MPDIKVSGRNAVPECVTPGRLIDYLKSRNPELDARFEAVPTEYMRLGEQLGVRWDYAFYQMILETGALSYRRGNRSGDVRAAQNNFAGLGATGGGASGESFKDVATGVRAHLEHLLLYSGQKLDSPVADRTRKVQEWGVLTNWHAKFNRPINFSDLAAQWAPGSGSYAKMIESIAERFEAYCNRPDPRPELLAEVRGRTQVAEAKQERPSGADLAKRAIADGKTDGTDQRSALGATEPSAERQTAKPPPTPYKILNAPQEAADQGAPQAEPTAKLNAGPPPTTAEIAPAVPTATSTAPAKAAAAKTAPKTTASVTVPSKTAPDKAALEKQPSFQVASAAGAAKPMAPPPAAGGQKCRVWTASYGGQKALIIKSVIDRVVNYTVLDVNEGAEKREADAFISAYAKDGAIAGEFGTQSQALDKAFEFCPEG